MSISSVVLKIRKNIVLKDCSVIVGLEIRILILVFKELYVEQSIKEERP